MASVTVLTPLVESGLRIEWNSGRVVPVLDSEESEAEWSYLQSLGLYGKHGHALDMQSCYFTDLVIAVGVLVGEGRYLVDNEGERQLVLEREQELKFPVPKGATT